MEKLKVQPELLEPSLDYAPPYQQIANAMKARGLWELGKAVPGDRARSLDLDREGRALRTLAVRRLTWDQLETLHRFEVKRNDFLRDNGQIRKMFKLDYSPVILSAERLDAIYEFNDDNRPEMRKEYGVTVPPYFPLDNEFDGLIYHHSWDKAVKVNDLVLPELKAKKHAGRRYLKGETDE